MAMNSEQKRRAADYVLRQMSRKGWDRDALTLFTRLDPQTVRTFLDGETWPQAKKRRAIEDALQIPNGRIEMAARGMTEDGPAEVSARQEEGDPVEQAIRSSRLSRANQFKLIGAYYDMLDEQGDRGEVRGA